MRKMKSSGVSSFGLIPETWKITKLKNILTLRSLKSGGIGQLLSVYLDRGVISYEDSDGQQVHKPSFDMSDYQIVRSGDFVLNNQQAWRGSVGVSKYNGIISPAYFVYAIDDSCDAEYMNYLLRCSVMVQQFETASRGVGTIQRNLFAPWLLNSWIVIPSILEQKKIASVLNEKCVEIDTLFADIQSEIETLEAYKQSKVFDAVGHGLGHVEFTPTDSDVWKTIPIGWNLVDIKYLFEIVKRIAGKEGYEVIAITQQGLKYKNISTNEGQIASDYSGYQFVYPGDYAMNHMDLLTGWVDLSDKFGVTSPDYRVFRLRYPEQFDRKYYKYVMQCCYMCRIFYSLGQGVSNLGRWRLQTSAFNDFKVPVPPYEEQVSIGNYLDNVISETNMLISQKQEQLSILTDYKKSIIYEYVTGKKEVPIA